MDDLLTEFLSETIENLGLLDSELVKLEQNPSDPTLLQNIFRVVHTIKGTCGFLGLSRLQSLGHAAENVLGRFRDGTLVATPDAIELVLAAVDGIKSIVSALAATQAEPAGDDAALIAELDRLAASEGGTAGPALAETDHAAAEVHFDAPETGHAATEAEHVAADKVAEPANAVDAAVAASNQAHAADIGAQNIRVNVDLLEDLMTVASELVLTRNQLMQILRTQKDSVFGAALQRLSQVTTELQEGVMKTRMQPIGNAWAKLPRLVRDLARDLSKKLDLRMIGAETELDRQVLEMVKDPLTHMVRNCADHGIEMPAERASAGKPEMGTITLHAHHVGGHIVVEIGDDGRGIAVDRIRKKVIANGLATEAELASMTEQQIQQFIFKPGFSTAEAITNISGRGVGLDVVRTNIEKIGGTVELRSNPGKGTKFVIKIPLTLAIVSALIVECLNDRFAIPQINVVELVHTAANSDHRVERLKGVPVLRLRDKILPLVSLRKMLGLNTEKVDGGENFVIVTQVGAQSFGILVDRVFDTEEIVVKPVSPMLRDLSVYSGNTILGDGSVVMILDPNGITALANFTGEEPEEQTAAHLEEKGGKRAENVILFRAGGMEPKALPLELVARLEMLDGTSFEVANERAVVQYRGALMPILSLDTTKKFTPASRQPILVFAEGERSVGVAVDEIIDIVQTVYSVDLVSERPGILGSAIIGGKATDLIDISHHLSAADANWFRKETQVPFGDDKRARRILLVDDSPFLRNMLQPLLKTAGYDVVGVESAESALKLCEDGERFDLIISDIEMPRIDGFGFAMKVRETENWSKTPLVALTSHVSASDEERGRKSGFQRHVPKLDHRLLLKAISETLATERGAA